MSRHARSGSFSAPPSPRLTRRELRTQPPIESPPHPTGHPYGISEGSGGDGGAWFNSTCIPLIHEVNPSSTARAIQDALHENLFAPLRTTSRSTPRSATAPLQQQPAITPSIQGKPLLLEGLARSTFPTASLTTEDLEAAELDSPSSSSIQRLAVTRTSIGSLKAIQNRETPYSRFLRELPLTSWWYQLNKDMADRMLSTKDRADTIDEEDRQIRTRYKSPKNPVVFCHGLFGWDTISLGPSAFKGLQISHWRGLKEILEANGVEVLIARVPATSWVEKRAAVLETMIRQTFPGRKVHLIGHSMGGLDCRYLASKLQSSEVQILSVTTIATPHKGSAFADYVVNMLGEERIPTVLSYLDPLPMGGGDGTAIASLTLEKMQKFNEDVPDAEGVKYFSWGAQFDPGLFEPYKWPHGIVYEKEGPNDGLVSVASSKWGTYLGTLEQVNHSDLVGWVNQVRYTLADWMGKSIKFKPATFYLEMIDYLAREVEGQTDDSGTDEGPGPSGGPGGRL